MLPPTIGTPLFTGDSRVVNRGRDFTVGVDSYVNGLMYLKAIGLRLADDVEIVDISLLIGEGRSDIEI